MSALLSEGGRGRKGGENKKSLEPQSLEFSTASAWRSMTHQNELKTTVTKPIVFTFVAWFFSTTLSNTKKKLQLFHITGSMS